MDYRFSKRISGLKPSAIREMLKHTVGSSTIPFAAGNPSPEAFPKEAIAEITAEILANDPITALQYGISEGYAPLREALKAYLKGQKGICNDADDLTIMTGAQQGIELATKVLCDSGDVIVCENPSFIGSLNAFRSYGVKLSGVDMEDDGMSMDMLEAALKREKNVSMIYTIPNFQNPAGVTMSREKREKVYALAKRYGVMILEDDPYGDLRYHGEDIPSIKSMDTDGIVIYIGSFSKIISPGLRVGYVVAPEEVMTKITVAKQASDVHTPVLTQMIVYNFMKKYGFKGHIEKIRGIYTKKLGLTTTGLETHLKGKISYVSPEGGLFVFCRLPDSADMPSFCRKSLENGVAVVPGSTFVTNAEEVSHYFRINFSTPTDEQLVKGIEILGGIL